MVENIKTTPLVLQNVGPLEHSKPFSSGSSEQAWGLYSRFIQAYTYNKEDLLYKVLHDKIYRPRVHSLILDFENYKFPNNEPKDLKKLI